MGRTYSCWMLNCWCITWPVGFKTLSNLRPQIHRLSIFEATCSVGFLLPNLDENIFYGYNFRTGLRSQVLLPCGQRILTPHFSYNIVALWFCPARNLSHRICALFCGTVNAGYFSTRRLATYFRDSYFSVIIKVNTPCLTENISHTHWLYLLWGNTTGRPSYVFRPVRQGITPRARLGRISVG